MSLYYRTLINSSTICLQYDVVNDVNVGDFINVTFTDCDGIPDSISISTPGFSQLICSSTTPIIVSLLGSGSVTATGLTC